MDTDNPKIMPDLDMAMNAEYGSVGQAMGTPGFDPYWANDPWSNNMAWPWVHEQMFLQDDPSLGMTFDLAAMNSGAVVSNVGWQPEPYTAAGAVCAWPTMANHSLLNVESNLQPDNAMTSGTPTAMGTNGSAHSNATLASTVTMPSQGPEQMVPLPARKLGLPSYMQQRASSTGVRTPDAQAAQRAVVDELTEFAFDFSKPNPDPAVCANFWHRMSTKVEQAFDLYHVCPTRSGGHHLLQYFLDLFFERFYQLWPMFRRQNFVYDRTPPHLFMTLASIGSMYAGEAAAAYGFMTHESVRIKLLVVPFQFQLPEEAYEPLCQSMVLIQVAALYFGHKQAFSIAQQLGSIIVSHARKFNLFNNTLAFQNLEKHNGRTPKADDIVANWTRIEGRKRLAFGILRADIFIGILLNNRPLVSFEEINLELPCPSKVWGYDAADLQRYVLNQFEHRNERRGMLYSDLVRIALDRGEALPSLKAVEFELLLFGLQQLVWGFSHDLDMMPRLTGRHEPISGGLPHNDLFGSWSYSVQHIEKAKPAPSWPDKDATTHKDLLDCSVREMNDLKADYHRATHVLRKWKQAFTATSMSGELELVPARSSLLASRLLYHLSFVRLRADIHTFHLLAHKVVKGEPPETSIQSVYRWSVSRDAKVALEHACAIWSLISTETERDDETRARFNIASHISLYHAAAVVWAFAGTHDAISEASLDMGETAGKTLRDDYRIHRGNNARLMSNFAALFKKITPAWITISSFTTTTSVMASRPFPLPPSMDNR